MFRHETVLKQEAVDGLKIRSEGIYVDCTLGGAGHSRMIAEQLGPAGTLVGLDQDDQAMAVAGKRLEGSSCRLSLVKSNFRHLENVLDGLGIGEVDGVLFDLGVSSPQLDEEERGFSYHQDAPLDMRMDRSGERTAFEIVNRWSVDAISRILSQYGEEKFARRIARRIVQARERKSIDSTRELAEIIKDAIPAPARRKGPHPARRSFQGIRIAVNDELNAFEEALEQAIRRLKPQGRLSVITFHSLEDRICKRMFQKKARGCVCPPDFPVCTCGRTPILQIINKKPVLPSTEEVENNPRARSAKLRIAEKHEEGQI
ncbi:16S rRNA (cytosine(1402)-N(4))-methyltransferase RsmH [Paludifilum halophilum]|uniref:Ribosomal RNA small subunit methyltransferase H n=1 Tax=Paludifilum halophilum TaxID=1642702 RepID=A0A235B2Z2_9BACL|nr:16S rRNA (cytosine(1402)-N(4))-methyltransferase RsmH [Paludifilum halophilum]OYD06612.1 16S rRNA (cytosine(1402)-N(4))-methyltransferase [Paludifilum halophilum]